MDATTIRAAALIILIIGFLGMWAWAWSKKRKPEFDRAARLPLEEDVPQPSRGGAKED